MALCLTALEICNLFGDPACCPTPTNNEFKTWALQLLCNIAGGAPGPEVRYDWEILCSPVDGRPIITRYEYLTDGTLGPTLFFEVDGITPYLVPPNPFPIACAQDFESTSDCLEVTVAGPWGAVGDIITRIRWYNASVTPPVFVGSTFFNETLGGVVPAVPAASSQPCGTTAPAIEGIVLIVAPLSSSTHIFSVPMDSISVWHDADYIVEVIYSGVGINGNQTQYAPPAGGGGGAVDIGLNQTLITQVDVVNTGATPLTAIINGVAKGS